MYKYAIVMYWSCEDDCYMTEVPELPGCMSDGKTPLEAISNIQTVIKEWIECAEERGETIPQPKGKLSYV